MPHDDSENKEQKEFSDSLAKLTAGKTEIYFQDYTKESKWPDENARPFIVPDIGEFTPLITKSPLLSLSRARFVNIPPHYHKRTAELFQFLIPAFGVMVVGGEVEEEAEKYYVRGGETIEIRPFTTVYVPPRTPHRMKVGSPGYAEAYLLNIPHFDGKDEIPLIVKKV